MAFPT